MDEVSLTCGELAARLKAAAQSLYKSERLAVFLLTIPTAQVRA
jgi:hypothetical protein